jgi:hypothetical protein
MEKAEGKDSGSKKSSGKHLGNSEPARLGKKYFGMGIRSCIILGCKG